ncbi:hypothetical protein SERLA73DRAFT_178364 [Serpula lacrymans var. lacrymans S7.3]|uniref:Isomerase YbhE n=2 Tax=Serpula lacrymans var. lacrymans TaxID=341189 RepID=F8PTJ7_SERL3|nr:uncharacterized protein SERLADRAFT_462767 [Serpula lacrymans var. lacrymans S7.9]EGO00525.1 hypothetical protein SERLA73DRAFT_178364 [Serpula lacrymans var. lacrymans S7.3]EGO26084.1 hypothetical protein SERLADRAFT_462767 [Serpula lacrymans var. lacrymans S7.9]
MSSIHKILVSSYTDKVYTVAFDAANPSLTPLSATTVGRNPSWLTAHPTDRSVVYAGLEQPSGEVVALKFDEQGKGEVVGRAPSGGGDPCTLLATENEVIIGNYATGVIATLPISAKSPYILSTEPWTLQVAGTGPNKERQKSSHPHQIIFHPSRDELLVPDLGADKIWRLAKGASGQWEINGYVQCAPGGGPRHIAFYGENLYTLYELVSVVVVHRFPPLPEEPTLLAQASTLTEPSPTPPGMLAAEILIPEPNKTYPTPYLYITNRNDPSPEGDTIAIFSIAEGAPRLVKEVRTGLKHVRGMVFGGEDDRWLIAGGVEGGGIKVFERFEGGGALKEVAAMAEGQGVSKPTGFSWL